MMADLKALQKEIALLRAKKEALTAPGRHFGNNAETLRELMTLNARMEQLYRRLAALRQEQRLEELNAPVPAA